MQARLLGENVMYIVVFKRNRVVFDNGFANRIIELEVVVIIYGFALTLQKIANRPCTAEGIQTSIKFDVMDIIPDPFQYLRFAALVARTWVIESILAD